MIAWIDILLSYIITNKHPLPFHSPTAVAANKATVCCPRAQLKHSIALQEKPLALGIEPMTSGCTITSHITLFTI